MKVKCFDCENVAFGTVESLTDKKWCGGHGYLNGRKIAFYLCPIHHTPERVVELIKGKK